MSILIVSISALLLAVLMTAQNKLEFSSPGMIPRYLLIIEALAGMLLCTIHIHSAKADWRRLIVHLGGTIRDLVVVVALQTIVVFALQSRLDGEWLYFAVRINIAISMGFTLLILMWSLFTIIFPDANHIQW